MAIKNEFEKQIKTRTPLGDEQLLAELGMRLDSIQSQLASADRLTAADVLALPTDDRHTMGPMADKFKELARTFLQRYNRALYNIVCNKDDPDSAQVRSAVDQGIDAVGVTVAALLTAQFAWLPAIAVVVASIVAKKFIRVGYEQACDLWLKQLS